MSIRQVCICSSVTILYSSDGIHYLNGVRVDMHMMLILTPSEHWRDVGLWEHISGTTYTMGV
ncbi:MAG: hypothetical protein IPO37_14000 [Saprospiraceae bacterium]|nr:hypothetical protein [Saprospiraceae bacterium]